MNNVTGIRIREQRLLKGYSQEELGSLVGVQKAAIHKYENGLVTNIKRSTISKLAKALDVSPIYLLGMDYDLSKIESINPINYHRIPKLGSTAAGIPCTVEYDGEDYVEVPEKIVADYCLDIHGDSMEPLIKNGDVVFFKYQNIVDNGDLAVVMIDGEATLKRFFKTDHQIQLIALNPNFPTIIINEDEHIDIRIVGKAISYNRKFK